MRAPFQITVPRSFSALHADNSFPDLQYGNCVVLCCVVLCCVVLCCVALGCVALILYGLYLALFGIKSQSHLHTMLSLSWAKHQEDRL